MDTTRPAWMPAQVTVESNKPFHIIMEGQATNGGFAVDDIIFTPGSCPSKWNKLFKRTKTESAQNHINLIRKNFQHTFIK